MSTIFIDDLLDDLLDLDDRLDLDDLLDDLLDLDDLRFARIVLGEFGSRAHTLLHKEKHHERADNYAHCNGTPPYLIPEFDTNQHKSGPDPVSSL
jgi:hypothetical protein